MSIYTDPPEWEDAGKKPPSSKRTEGWKPGDRVPASWLNWFWFSTVNSLKELAQSLVGHRKAKTDTHGIEEPYRIAKTTREDQRIGWDDVVEKPDEFPPEPHEHDDRYHTKSEISQMLSGVARKVTSGIAEDGDRIDLDYDEEPLVIISPVSVRCYSPDHPEKQQQLAMEAINVSKNGFDVYAKLLDVTGQATRHEFPEREYTWSYGNHVCGDYSSENIGSEGDYKRYVTSGDEVTEVSVRVRRMMHVTAPPGNHRRYQRMAWRLRIREVGASSWFKTLGPYDQEVRAHSSTFTRSTTTVHPATTYTFEDLPPAKYEVEVQITSKSWNSGQYQDDSSSWLVVDYWEERSSREIVPSFPNKIMWTAMEV